VYVVVQPCIDYVRNEAKETTPTEDQNLVVSMLRLWRALLKVYDDEATYPSPLDKKSTASIIESAFIFACVWSICISINTEFRRPFDQQFKKICNGDLEGIPKLKNKILPSAFDRGTVYDYVYYPETNQWKNWMDGVDKEKIDDFPKGTNPAEIVVTTVDTVRYGYMQEMFIMNDIRTLFVGPTGTGKTAYIQNVINNQLS
jgi:dynein heavy chain